MKKRDVILDFTSLLDVTLIVIFFFVIFSHLDTEDNRAKTEAKVAELETAIEEAEEREASAEELITQLEKEIDKEAEYYKSDEYIAEIAREKLGILKDNEIIFSEDN